MTDEGPMIERKVDPDQGGWSERKIEYRYSPGMDPIISGGPDLEQFQAGMEERTKAVQTAATVLRTTTPGSGFGATRGEGPGKVDEIIRLATYIVTGEDPQ